MTAETRTNSYVADNGRARYNKNNAPSKERSIPKGLSDSDLLSGLRSEDIDIVKIYLNEAGKVPLLTAPQEVTLSLQYQSAAAARVELAIDHPRILPQIRKIAFDEILSKKRKEEAITALISDSGDTQKAEKVQTVLKSDLALQHLLLANLRLVISIAKKYTGRGLSLLDLIQEGNMGLMKAAGKFDPLKGHKFSTYATWWIRQGITRSIADQARVIRLPVHMAEDVNRMLKVSRRLAQQLSREPFEDEIAAEMKISPDKLRVIMKAAERIRSLDEPVGPDDDEPLHTFVADDKANIDTINEQARLKEKIAEVLLSLTDRERKIMTLRYGLADGRPRTLEEVGQEMGVTRERIRQIETRILRKLRHPTRARSLKDFI